MAITYLGATKISGLNGGTTPTLDTTGASLLVITAAYNGSITISDSKGNTWTALTAVGTAPIARIYYCANPTVGPGHTFTVAGTSTVSSIVAAAFAGVKTASPADTEPTGGNTSGSGTNAVSVNYTPSEDAELLVSGHSFGSLITTNVGANGWTKADFNDYVGGTSYGSGMVYLIQTTAAEVLAATMVATFGASTGPRYAAAAFKAAPPGSMTGSATLDVFGASGTMAASGSSDLSGSATADVFSATGNLGIAPGTLTTPVLKNNTGTVLASVTGIVANVYHPTTGALVVRVTGLSSNGSGIVTITDALIVAGTTYAYELDLSATTQGRRLPTGVAA